MNFTSIKVGRFFLLMLLFIPISIYCSFFSSNNTLLFITSILAIVPLARIMGYATNELTIQTNPAIGGLISATFGNSVELIIAAFALKNGLIEVVQASIIGSIIVNILLLIGLSIFFGGLRFKQQRFNNEAIGVSSTMLIIVVAGFAVPSLFAFFKPDGVPLDTLSDAVAVVMALIYVAGLVFSLMTHKHLFAACEDMKCAEEKPVMSKKVAVFILLCSILIISLESEFLVRGIGDAATTMGVTQFFIGLVVVGVITNVAEIATAIHFGIKNKIDISIEIGLNSATQIALFVAPVLIVISQIGNYGFSLVFSLFGILAVFLAVMIVNYLSADGRCNWLEGAQLISIYSIIAIAFYFV